MVIYTQKQIRQLMKKIIYVFAVASLSALACTGGNAYKITGIVNGAANGDTVYIQNRVNREFVKIDSAIITDGKFIFNGKQDSTVNRYITYMKGDRKYYADFFLENGDISLTLGETDSIVGTPSNDTYHAFKSKMNAVNAKMEAVYSSMQSPTLSEEQRKEKTSEMNALEKSMTETIAQTIDENIGNAVGLHLLKAYNYYIEYDKLGEVLAKVPAKYQKNEDIIRLNDLVKTAKATSVGQKFVDFSMLTPEGKPIKLSDYAGKGKYVLVDFWASWCGPCRQEMPNLVKAYAQYKSKGFEIVGVSLDRDGKSWTGGIQKLNITWPQMSDLKYWDCQGSKLYAIRSIPHTVLLDKDGKIIARGLHGEELQAKLAELMK
jgi:Peroxiredoxin